ncbi:MAG: 50S ribosomal protein L3 [Firmicutes bacterium]|nr:50S ribosomal protein L3 [Bacillota bacterium]
MKTILGKKVGMTQIFTEAGEVIPVTVIEAGPETVTQIKTVENDGYAAVQVGFEDAKPQRVNKPMTGHFAKNDIPVKKHLAEFRIEEGETYEVGQVITAADFEVGSKLDITGTSKGKGTQGEIKRHGHHRGPMTHGSKHKRLAGAKAGASYPGRVFKGNKESGRMGRETVTVQNVVLVKVIEERNLMLVKGAVPGNKGGLVRIQYAVKGQDK